VIFIAVILITGIQALDLEILLTLFVFFTLVIVTFAGISRAPGLTDEEKHQKPRDKEEKEVPKSPPWPLCCFVMIIVIMMAILLTSASPSASPIGSQMMMAASAFLVLLFMFTACFLAISRVGDVEESSTRTPTTRPIPPKKKKTDMRVAKTTTEQLFWQSDGTRRPRPKPTKVTSKVRAARGGEIIGGRFRFKVKVINESKFTVNDITVYILSYPRDTLLLKTEDDDVFFSKIEPEGFRSPTFDFLPTQDCVRGVITAGVSYVDASGKAHTLTTEPFTIRAVCDLLQPQAISPKDFELKLQGLESGEIILKVEEWTPSEMQEKTLRVLSDSNFHEVSSEESDSEGVVHYKISGWAKGKYTGKNVGAEILISGEAGKKGASCTIRVAGEDDAMILPAIDDLKERLSAYLCPMCGSKLTLENVEELKKGKVVCCPFCDVSIGR
jgi:hypothetical protein